jgi:hypothetical protein
VLLVVSYYRSSSSSSSSSVVVFGVGLLEGITMKMGMLLCYA